MSRIAVVGSGGRVGTAICRRLAEDAEIVAISRPAGHDVHSLADAAVEGVDIVVNAAGVAHIEHPAGVELERLREGNVELPAVLARAAVGAGVGLLHVSSVKAADPGSSPYAQSKWDGEQAIRAEWSVPAAAGLSALLIRPRALLIPPFDAGRLARLRWVRHVPGLLTPPIPLPALSERVFVEAAADLVEQMLTGSSPLGCTVYEFAREDRATLRDVRGAMLHSMSRSER